MGDAVTERLEGIEGVVKWFDSRKGFGFITGPEGQDIFVHYTVIEGDGFRALKDGCSVRYDAEKSEKGWRSTFAAAIDEPESAEGGEVVVPKRTYSRSPRR